MKTWWMVLVVVGFGAGCKGKSSERSAESAATPEEAPFVRVDSEQLAALCMGSRLPAVSYPSDFGALALSDGTRVPWLTIWIDEQVDEKTFVPIVAWKTSALAVIKQFGSGRPGSAPKRKPGQVVWINSLCGGDTADVAITGVFFQKDAFYALAIRGSEAKDEKFPTTTPREAVFRRAFELTDELLGGKSAAIANHTLGGSESLATVTTQDWVKAANKR